MELNWVVELVIAVLATFAAASIGTLATFKAIPTWYTGLKKPRLTPPNRAFGPVWTALYILMAVSAFLVWDKGLNAAGATLAFVLYWIQLAFNAFWSVVFFGLKSKGGGVFVIVTLWLLILAALVADFRVSIAAGALLIPYILWVSLASYLNIGVWLLNKNQERSNVEQP